MFVCAFAHTSSYTLATVHRLKSQNSFLELFSLFLPHRSLRPGNKHVYWLSHLVSPESVIFNLSKVLLPVFFFFSWPILTIGKTYPSNKRTSHPQAEELLCGNRLIEASLEKVSLCFCTGFRVFSPLP